MRRALVLVTAVGTLVEGVVIAGSLLLLGTVIGASSMSLNGSDPSTARAALWGRVARLGVRLRLGHVRAFHGPAVRGAGAQPQPHGHRQPLNGAPVSSNVLRSLRM